MYPDSKQVRVIRSEAFVPDVRPVPLPTGEESDAGGDNDEGADTENE